MYLSKQEILTSWIVLSFLSSVQTNQFISVRGKYRIIGE